MRRGETLTFRDKLYPITRRGDREDAWFTLCYSPLRDEFEAIAGVLVAVFETTARIKANAVRDEIEAKLREGEERQRFLLEVSDALRPLAHPAAVEGEVCWLLAEQLDVDRAYYVEVDEKAGTARVTRDFVRGDAPSLAGEHRVSDFAWSLAILRRGECHVIADTQVSELVPPIDRPASAALQIIACMGAPLIRDGRLVGALCVTASQPRAWTENEVELLREVGERVWSAIERARAEGALSANLASLGRLHELQGRLAGETDLKTALEDILAAACTFTHTDRGCVQLVSNDGARLEMCAWRGYVEDDPFIRHFRHAGSEAVCDAARRNRSRLIIENVKTFPPLAGTQDREVALADGIHATQSTPMISRKGETIGVLSTQFPQPHRPNEDELRLIDILAWIAADFVERHRAEATLRESEGRFRVLADNMAQLAWTCDSLGNVDWYNRRWLDYTGMTFEQMQGWGWRKVQHPDHVDRVVAHVQGSAESGEPWEDTFPLLGKDGQYRWFLSRAIPIRDQDGGIVRWFGTNTDVTATLEAEAALRLSEQRQTFLLKLSDALRPLDDSIAIMAIASEKLGCHLGVGRCGYGEVDASGEFLHIERDWTNGVMASLKGTLRLADFGPQLIETYRRGETVVVDDACADARARGVEDAFEAIGGLRASLAVPLLKGGCWVSVFYAQQTQPRHWTPAEQTLIEEVAERTWSAVERARAEENLRRGEMLSRAQGRVLELAVADKPLEAVLDKLVRTIEEQSQSGMRGSILLLDDDGAHLRMGAAPHLPQAFNEAIDGIAIGPAAGVCGTAAYRKQPVHVANVAADPLCADYRPLAAEYSLKACSSTPILSMRGQVLGTVAMYYANVCEPAADDSLLAEMAARTAALVIERQRATQHRDLLIAELNHRVKNTLATVQSLAVQTFRGVGSDEATATFESRLIALSVPTTS